MKSIPALLADRYEIVRRVGTGGMADVYLARDTQLNRQVALKILHSQYAGDEAFVERFRREAHAAANLQHPNIVQIYDWGREDDYHFIVMEFVEGRSLKDLIAADSPLPSHQACEIADQVLDALATAHRAGLVHRDIKPGNILLGRDGEAHVTDFGIARAASGDTMTQTGTILGTAYYLSPEQAQGHPTDGRSDLYSLGIVLYEMVAGRRPFEGDSPVTIAMKHVREHPKPPSEHNPSVSTDLSAIILTALAKNPEDRYSTAAQMRRDVRAFLEGKDVTAALPAPSGDDTQVIKTVGPVQRAATRRPGWMVALALALLVGGLALGAWSLINLLRPMVGGAEVPEIVNRTPTDAENVLRAAGLEPSFQGNEPSETIEEGRVTRQLPDPGHRVTTGVAVQYWVSSGLPFVAVPDVKGIAFNQARARLEQAGLTVGEREEVFHETVPAGAVIDQNPRAEAQVRKRTPIDLTISRGPEVATVPNVVGMDERAALQALFNAGFRPQQVDDFRADVPNGVVFDQDPAGGQQRPSGSTVQIFVSRGPEEFAMPNVVGMTEANARNELQRRGLVVRTQNVFTSDPNERGRVLRQDPTAGTPVRRGQTVTIQVGSS
ncbi:MAG TPA: Stk1 family PASTA domain-containing Ser/Thr kinase [Actinomycetota bacterium]|nr:Stk1 family PASTA domain-containing Ser/Thr kinase [Actinomycetota bacterium]